MLKYLLHESEYQLSRKNLSDQKLSFLSEKRNFLGTKILSPKTGDLLKSWDVENSIKIIVENIPKDLPILDLGSYGSELPWCLDKLGYKNIHGIDLNLQILTYPTSNIQWKVGNYHHTEFDNDKFECVTAISVIEHGYSPELLLPEIYRILKIGGKFIISFDFWPDKVDTSNEKIFDLTWTIFSENEVNELLIKAHTIGFKLIDKIFPNPVKPAISYNNKNYTFAFMCLEKI